MGFNDEQSSGLKCSFCGKREEQVRRLIAGRGVYICNECIAVSYTHLTLPTIRLASFLRP